MNNKYILSVIVPIYNREKTISRCIESIVNQPIDNMEIILINDGSTDRSLEIIQSFCKKYSNIKVITIPNSGPGAARNKGIEEALGKYITFVDSDDTIEKNAYNKLLKAAFETEADIVCSSYYRVEKEKKYKVKSDKIKSGIYEDNEIKDTWLYSYYSGIDKMIPSLCNKIYNVKFIRSNMLRINENYKMAEDYWFNFEILEKAKKLIYIDEPYYNYYDNDNSIMHDIRDDQFAFTTLSHELLLKRNNEYKFDINYDKFFESYLYETAMIIRTMICIRGVKKSYNEIMFIMKNDTYKRALKHSTLLPKHIQVLNRFVKNKMYLAAVFMYWLWSKKEK